VTRIIRLACVLVLVTASQAAAQQILFDKPIKAGALNLFRDLRDEKAYYFEPAHPRLATDANGQPKFSFFRWVDNVRSGPKDTDVREGDGGGIIHALVTFGVSKEEVAQAQRELQRQVPGARIAGPIVPKSGTFALISTAQDPTAKIATNVFGVGNAPLLDGDEAALSIKLTKDGARTLWQQFQSSTPDLSFQFEWTIDGFRAPIGGVIEANLDEIVKHDAFNVGIAGNFYGAQIKGAFDELRRKNVIKVTQYGGDDAKEANLANMFKKAYDTLVDLLFDKTSPAAAAANAAAAAPGSGDDWIGKATNQLSTARTHAEAVRAANEEIKKKNAEKQAKRDAADEAEKHLRQLEGQLREAEAAAKQAAPAAASDSAAKVAELRTKVDAARTDAQTKRFEATKAGPDEKLKDPPAEPGFALMASYELKRSHATGIYKIDLNKYASETRVVPVRGNVGDLRPLFKSGAFRQVNLDDPLYKQREITAILDGMNAEDFSQYINFVSVRLRKTHEGGELTEDEVRVDRKNFSQEGASFKMLYGWKGDNNRQRWMDYEYQAIWSFFGGYNMQMPWTKWSANEIGLSPPLQRRSIELQGDPRRLAEQGVRAVSVKVYYRTAPDGPEQVKQLTLNAAAPTFVGRIDFVAPKNAVDYEYEVAWRLAGNREVGSGRQKTSFTMLNLDDVPK
jgi:hypothetical protein